MLFTLQKEILILNTIKFFGKIPLEEDRSIRDRPNSVRTHVRTRIHATGLISRNCLNARVIESRSAEIGLAA